MEKQESKVSWTEEQQKVIDYRNRNILVSAAAGSGKTAVLVERIITMISDKEKPIDIDRLLVVTFTNAAAAEMSERIATALEKKVELEPDNMHLRRQVTLVRNAHICTFHSFCQSVIRNHFNEIGVDPSFRIGDETELKLMKNDVLDDVFEKHYEAYRMKKAEAAKNGAKLTKEEKAFVNLVECYAGNRDDDGLRKIVLQLYEFAMSAPFPEEWLEEKKTAFQLSDIEEMEQSAWMQELYEYIGQTIEALVQRNIEALAICKEKDGPDMYQEALTDDQAFYDTLSGCKTYRQIFSCIQGQKWKMLGRKKSHEVDKDKQERVKAIRDDGKGAIKKLQEQFFFQTPEEMLRDMRQLRLPMETLLDLVKEFKQSYSQMKEEKRVVDFNDLEHYALRILLHPDTKEPTAVAKAYCREFAEILVDEYQDSNEVQETILGSISKKEPEDPNLFMVGDVKQSIYKFRMAKPELFMQKYETYALEESKYQRIDLHKNFRSRGIVLDSVNEIFERIMKKSLGKVEYDKSAALYLGNTGFKESETTAKTTELLLFAPEECESEEEDDVEAVASKVEIEARMVAARIKELCGAETSLQVTDKETGELRSCRYGDISILLRTMSGWSEVYLEVLKNAGIPVYTDTSTGYFSAYEIRIMLQFLKVIDNPRQDIPLAAVMRSMLGGFTAEEMSIMRNQYANMDLYDTIDSYRGLHQYGDQVPEGIDVSLSRRVDTFLEQLEYFRSKVSYMPIPKLLEQIYVETGFYDYVSVMPNGAQRRDNLDMLVQKAIAMEATNLSTLFHFNRYIEKLHKYEVDFGEAQGSDTVENAVHIMSIHKSKGLEFPVVFVGAMAKSFNNQDARSKIVLHSEIGVGADLVDPEKRTKVASLIKKVIARQSVLENLGEELRVLYVALTRAKEKLIMAGYVSNPKNLEDWRNTSEEMDYFSRVNAKNYLDWVAPVIFHSVTKRFECKTYGYQEIVKDEMLSQVKAIVKKSQLEQWDSDAIYEEEFHEEVIQREKFVYPYEKEKEIKSKLSVSELKHAAMDVLFEEEKEQEGIPLSHKAEPEEEIPVPAFMKEELELNGAGRGTLYHKVFEKLKLNAIDTLEDVEQELQRMETLGYVSEDAKKQVNCKDILQFVNSELGKRMRSAEERQSLWREQPFVYGLPAKIVREEWESEELILVQGIIDVFFEEEDGLVLVDYKTDRIKNEKILIEYYQTQLTYYKKALEQVTGKNVKEMYIYSVTLGKAIQL